MRATLANYWLSIRSSYWFVPTIMTLGAIALSTITTLVERGYGGAWAWELGWLSLNTPDGARAVLSTIAGSMITVAGVTFSITIAALAYASSQLGPRLLGNFMRDTSNQVTLGTFVATFVYCLLILRTVYGGSGQSEVFVPQLGVMVALILTLASLGVLIFFIHHIPMSIQASEVIASIGKELNHKLQIMFPHEIGRSPPGAADAALQHGIYPAGSGSPVAAVGNGYLTNLDAPGLLDAAIARNLVIRLVKRPGDFVSDGEPLAFVYGEAPEDEALCRSIRRCFVLDRERTQAEDILFVVQQLVEIAARALSPGVNDPYTAIRCQDWIGSALINLGKREMPGTSLHDDAGRLRVLIPHLSYSDVVSAALDHLRPYASGDRNAALHMMGMLGGVLDNVTHPPYRGVLLEHAAAVRVGAETGLGQERDRREIRARYERLCEQHGRS